MGNGAACGALLPSRGSVPVPWSLASPRAPSQLSPSSCVLGVSLSCSCPRGHSGTAVLGRGLGREPVRVSSCWGTSGARCCSATPAALSIRGFIAMGDPAGRNPGIPASPSSTPPRRGIFHLPRRNTTRQQCKQESWLLWEVLFHRNLELLRLEKPSQVTEWNHSLSAAEATPNHVPKCHIHAAPNPSRDGDSIPLLWVVTSMLGLCQK